ncbi:hypothetical protein Agabi119p4_1378 [Agaricus bisporus var. burnettii]|uniref:Uncharacterized protein n=1 Tax=Agaricus bisporus var. burnettii TaxID=192524 RepID=A0A8H7KLM8_AGABI|nr:hypothetical protein Agabi119p4_1378 [Agaricus bisporus var. burnettii]
MKFLESPSSWSARGRAFFTRLTLTRFTLLYFTFALLACLILVVLEGVTLANNHAGTQVLSGIIAQTNPSQAKSGLPLFSDGKLVVCDDFPNQSGAVCRVMWKMDNEGSILVNGTSSVYPRGTNDQVQGHAFVDTRIIAGSLDLPDNCIYSLRWLRDIIQDGIREDIVVLCFQFWLLSLALVTLVTESIPHLGAGIFGHLLGTVWAGYRIHSTSHLESVYKDLIVPGVCSNRDFLGNWWDQTRAHAIGVLVVYACTLVALTYLSYKLLIVFANQSFARVGASNQIRRIYKIILLFSAGLQLALFFSIAAIGLWLGKINHAAIGELVPNQMSLLVALVVALVLLFPWLILGWVCVRRECWKLYIVFCTISLFLIVLFSVLFSTPIYQFILISSSFFGTITITSYICVVTTAILGVICRLNFGKGLVHYLEVDRTLAGMNFTTGTFYDHKADPEKNAFPSYKLPAGVELKHDSFIIGHGSSRFSVTEGVPIRLSSTPSALKRLILVPNEQFGDADEKESMGMKNVLQPPSPAWLKRPSSTTSNAGSLLSDLPLRLSSLASLRKELNEFPVPPSEPPAVIASRYAPRFHVPLDIKDDRAVDIPKRV